MMKRIPIDVWMIIVDFSGEKERKSICLTEKTGEIAYNSSIPTIEKIAHCVRNGSLNHKMDYKEYFSKFKTLKLLDLTLACYEKKSNLLFDLIELNRSGILSFLESITRQPCFLFGRNTKAEWNELIFEFKILDKMYIVNQEKHIQYLKKSFFLLVYLKYSKEMYGVKYDFCSDVLVSKLEDKDFKYISELV